MSSHASPVSFSEHRFQQQQTVHTHLVDSGAVADANTHKTSDPSTSSETTIQKVADRLHFEKASSSRSSAVFTSSDGWFKSRLRRVTGGRMKPSQQDRHKSLENLNYAGVDAPSSSFVRFEITRPLSVTHFPLNIKAAVDSAQSDDVDVNRPCDENLQRMVVKELIETEKSYVSSLKYVIDNYIPEMLRADLPHQLLGQRNVIFGNIEKMYEFHVKKFIPDLLNYCTDSTPRIGMAVARRFLQHQAGFGLYALYNKNKPKSDALMIECGSFFFQHRQLVLRDQLNLFSYLLKPVQRMCRYVLMLDKLIKGCAGDDHQQLSLLRDAKEMINFQLRHGDDLLAMDSIRGCDLSLNEQGNLIRQDEFVVYKHRGSHKCVRRIFLFESLVLFAKPRKSKSNHAPVDVFDYKQSIKMTDVGLTEKVDDAPLRFELWFRRRTSSETFVIQAYNDAQKQCWITDISKLLWKQAILNRENRLAAVSSTGSMATNCFELNSANRIENRDVMFSRDSKLRNTLSGSVAAHDRLPFDRRPRSWVSVASSSSSTWSSISGSTNSYCTPDSIPLSYESGIGTDLTTLDEFPDDGFNNSWEREEESHGSSGEAKQCPFEHQQTVTNMCGVCDSDKVTTETENMVNAGC